MVNKRVQNSVLWCNLKNERMISVSFQGKIFSITEIQVYVPTRNAEEAEVEQFLGWEDPLEKEMAIHSSILAWIIPWTEELGGLQSIG